MALWRTHIKIAEMLIKKNPEFDNIDFIIGHIAPDCNTENSDFTKFIPSREETHFMDGKSKLTTNFERFCKDYLVKANSKKELNFYIGYLGHLITDTEFQKFIRNDERVKTIFQRVEDEKLGHLIEDLPKTFDTLKSIFGKQRLFGELERLELDNINDDFWSRLVEVSEYQMPMKMFEPNSVGRKIPIMTELFGENNVTLLLFSRDEYQNFLDQTVKTIEDYLGGIEYV